MILEKMRSFLRKMELWFWIYSWIRLLCPSGSNVVSRSQAPRSINFLAFQNLLDSSYDSWKKRPCLWILEPGFWTYGWIRLLSPSRRNVVPRPLAPRSINFWGFIILLDFSHDLWENEVWFVKIGARVLDLQLDMSCGPKWPKCSF